MSQLILEKHELDIVEKNTCKSIKLSSQFQNNIDPSFLRECLTGQKIKPISKIGLIHSLQRYRELGRKDAEATFLKTRPLEGSSLNFLSIRMIEVFQLEQQEKLYDGLEKLFPELDGNNHQQTFKEYFGDLSNSITSGGWKNIGTIFRENKIIGPTNTYRMPDLPSEVDYINISLHKTLPSILVITLDVYLKRQSYYKFK